MQSKVLIIIPVYNGVAEFLGDCLSSLRKIDFDRGRLEILAIDDISSDGSVAYIRNNFPEVVVIENEKNLGFAGTNNVGLRYAIERGFDYAYMLNQDTAVGPDFLKRAVAVMEADKQVGAVQSKLLLYHQPDKVNSIGNEIHFLGFAFAGGYLSADRKLGVREIAYPSGAAALLNVRALAEVGILNEDLYMYHEDTDLGWRLWLGGWKVMLAPESVVYHKYEFSRSISKYYFMERNRTLLLLQNYRLGTLVLIMPALLAMDFSLFFYSMHAGWFKNELKVCAYFFKPGSWQKIWKTRHYVQMRRKIRDREVVSRFTGKVEFQGINNPLLTLVVNPVFNLYWQIIRRLIWW